MRPPNGLFIFLGKKTHSETKSWKSSRILTEKVNNNNGKPWKSSRILRVIRNFFIIFQHFSFSFHFFIFSFSNFSFSFIFFVFFNSLSFSFFLFPSLFSHCSLVVLSCLLDAQNLNFLGHNFVTISLDSSYVKNQFLGHLGGTTFGHSFPFFSSISSFLSSFLFFFHFSHFCSFLHFLFVDVFIFHFF